MIHDRCVNVNAKSAITIVILFFLNGIRESQTAVNLMEGPTKVEVQKNSSLVNHEPVTIVTNVTETAACPHELECAKLEFPCIKCNYNTSCLYGQELNVSCEPNINVQCSGERSFVRFMKCKYCYQSPLWQYDCIQKGNCNSMDQYYKTNCTVHENVLCLGRRTFYKNVKCNWTQGYKWSTALLISLALGGFGADRFYLGHWQEGIGKLFSFGGLGVWTIIDVVLISLHYLGPADGSLYI